MPESSNNEQGKPSNKGLDLSELQNLSFGPNWSERKESHTSGGRSSRGSGADHGRREGQRGGGRDRRPPRREDGGQRRSGGGRSGETQSQGGGRQGGGQGRDERPFRPRGEGGVRQGEGQREGGQRFRSEGRRGERSRGGHRADGSHEPPFEPVVDVLFYPEDTPFKALSHAMRSSCRTYELFEIARLILDKPDRHVIVVKPREDGKGITQLYQSVPDGLPFGSEEEAFAHVLSTHIERFFEVSEEACEPPKGNFPSISRCGITGKLLGPPNYHLYQQFLLEHHTRELPNMPFERFQARIESVKDEAVVAQWLEQMSTQTRYKLKQPQEGEQEIFESIEAVKLFLKARHQNEVVRKVSQARIPGTQVESLPQGAIRKSLLAALAHQKRFPLESANNLRGRLRRLKFTIYKRKGVSFVCAVKRNFRDEATRFSESVQALVAFIETNPNIQVGQLPERYLGIELQRTEHPALPAGERVPDIEAVPEEEARKIVEAHELKHHHGASATAAKATAAEESTAAEGTTAAEGATIAVESTAAKPIGELPAGAKSAVAGSVAAESAAAGEQASAAGEQSPAVEAASPSADGKDETATVATADAAATESAAGHAADAATDGAATKFATGDVAADAESAASASAQLEDPRVRQLLNDLRWLIAEGYVTEFGDGRLYAAPVLKTPPPADDKDEDEIKQSESDDTEPEVK